MRKLFIFGLLATMSLPLWATGNVENGKAIAGKVCVACHGADGNSAAGMYPKIAGQHEVYLKKALTEYRKADKGGRNNGIMVMNATNLSDQDIADLAAFFSSQKMSAGNADKAQVELGQKLYRGGDAQQGIPACMACHGPTGMGNRAAGYPQLSGQHAEYLLAALKEYRSGERKNIVGNGMMNDIAKKMSDEQMTALASYISGLH